MRKNQWMAAVFTSLMLVLPACGVEEEAPAPLEAAMPQEDVAALAGPGHGCPTAAHACVEYCTSQGNTSGRCSGYGRASCVCRK